MDRLEVYTSAQSKVLKPCTGRKYILPDRCGFLKPWTGWKYILPDRCGFYQNFNLGLGGSLNFQTGAGFSEKNNPHVSGSIYFRPVQGFKNPHLSGSIYFRPVQGYPRLYIYIYLYPMIETF